MAQKVSKKKKPDRYHYLLKEREKIEDCAIDKYVLLIISNLRRKKIFYTLDYPISTGKEANIYRATTHDGDFVVVKIFRLDTTHFF